ncbi:hypothetical protein [uncultured Methanoregula sp.]|uniref:hypothetical protein n=1 Tax=uncultured Methanoregula sp. TaxID=1005933 RepID=UPI002AAABE62|nr:hypothetical protein [uncultured Methanoregula sp.]
MADDESEENFDISGVHPWLKYGLAILIVLALIGNLLSGNVLIGIVVLAIAWFFSGPQCVKLAKRYGRSQNWAFLIGILFNLVGVFFYWIYTKIVGKRDIEEPD